MNRDGRRPDLVGSRSVDNTVGATYLVIGMLILWWVIAPLETLHAVFVDTPTRVAQTAEIFRSAATRSGEHPNSWRVRPYPLIHHGVIQAEPAMLGLDHVREMSLRFQVGREYRFVDEPVSQAMLASADTTYVIDPAVENPWQPPLLMIDGNQPTELSGPLLEQLSNTWARDRHLIVVITATDAILTSEPLCDWLAGHGINPGIFEGPSRPALAIIPPESSAPRIPYVIAPPSGFFFQF